MRKVLTVAGSDSGGGAGIQADLRTMTVIGVFGMSAVCALTAQNTREVTAIFPVTPEFLAAQLDAVLGDLGADAVKTGMVHSAPLIAVLAERLRRHRLERVVVDPVMVSKGGQRLLEREAEGALVRELLPRALVVTPNLEEAAILAGAEARRVEDMVECARRIADLGPRYVVVKGGHLAGGQAVDIFWDGSAHRLVHERLEKGPVHGTGCTFSAALASFLALGHDVPNSVAMAKEFVTGAIAAALPLGGGYPPANQLYALEKR